MKVKLPVLPGEKFYGFTTDFTPVSGVVPTDYSIELVGPWQSSFNSDLWHDVPFQQCYSNKGDFDKVLTRFRQLRKEQPDRSEANALEEAMNVVKREEKELDVPDYLMHGEVVILNEKKLIVTEASYLVGYDPEKEDEYPENYIVYLAFTEDNQSTEFTSLDNFIKTGEVENEEEIIHRYQDIYNKSEVDIDAIWQKNLKMYEADLKAEGKELFGRDSFWEV